MSPHRLSWFLGACAMVVSLIAAGMMWFWEPAEPTRAPKASSLPETPQLRSQPRQSPVGKLVAPVADAVEDPDSTHGALSGTVLDGTTNAPLEGAEVSLLGPAGVHSVVTNGEGEFTFAAPSPDRFALISVLADGYYPHAPGPRHSHIRFQARSGQRIEGANIVLWPRRVRQGRVVTPRQQPVAGSEIRILRASSGTFALATVADRFVSAREGWFSFTAPAGTWLEAEHPEHGVGRARVEAPATEDTVVVLRPDTEPAEADIAGMVLDPEGTPVADAEVRAMAPGDGPSAVTTTDEDGRFSFDHLRPVPHRVQARDRIHAPATVDEVATGTADVRLRLQPGGGIEGTIRTEQGAPVSSAALLVLRHTGSLSRTPQTRTSVLDPEGHYVIHGLPPGTYDVLATAPDLASIRTAVDVTGTEIAPLDLVLPGGATIHGRIVDEDTGDPLPLARVEVEHGFSAGSMLVPVAGSDLTDNDGTFTIEGAAPGRQSLSARAPDHQPRTRSGIAVSAGETVGPLEIALAPVGEDGAIRFEVVGIGVALQAAEDALEVTEVLDGGGAKDAGVGPGDRIVTIDGASVVELGFEQAIQAIRGRVDTIVTLELQRAANPNQAEVIEVLRRRIRIPE